jgi:EpsD family peptidyl-prolyl cis-trans isomerase
MTVSLRTLARVASLTAVAAVVAACGGSRPEGQASQTAAKVNKEEITVHQINYALSRQRAVPADQAASASQRVLESLIEQQLAIDKGAELKLDRDPAVVQQLDAARREILARAYLNKVSEGAPKPTAAEVTGYYEANPGLFRDRKVYTLQEALIEATPEQAETLKKQLDAAKTVTDFLQWARDNGYKVNAQQGVRAAEQLPLNNVARFAAMKDGETFFRADPGRVYVMTLVSSRTQPVNLEQATPAIESYLLNERKRKLLADDLAALRGAAKIEYVGTFAAAAASAPKPAPEAPAPTLATPPVTTLPQNLPAAAPQIDVAPVQSQAGSQPSSDILEKGMSGLKR